ncbi:MAG: hypothetical protein ABIK09_12050 [Pseudomonadota bacterium]
MDAMTKMGSALGMVLVLVLAAGACGEREAFWDRDLGITGPVVLSDGGAFLSNSLEELIVVRADRKRELVLDRYPVAEAPQVIKVMGDDRILLWSKKDKTLDLVDPDGKAVRSYDLGTAFGGFRVSPEERFVVAWVTLATTTEDFFVNAGQVAVVDLQEDEGPSNPRLISLKSYGDAPLGVYIAPAESAAGEIRQPALVTWRSYVSILDLRDDGISDVSVPLRPGDSDAEIYPGLLRFAEGDEDRVRAYFISTSSNDLYEITIASDQLQESGAGAVAINLFPTAPAPLDFSIYRLDDGTLRIATICGSNRLVITDPESSETLVLQLAINPNRLKVFEMQSLDSTKIEVFALISSGSYSQFYLVELEHIALKMSKALHLTSAPAPVADVIELPGQGQFLLFHTSGDSAISVAEPANDKLTSILGTGSMETRLFLEDDDLLLVLTIRDGARYLVAMDTVTLHARAVELDGSTGQAASLIPLPDESMVLIWLAGEQRLVRVPLDFKDRSDLTDYPMFLFDELMD